MIRILMADDQHLVRGALAALLNLEPDLEVVAEVAREDQVVATARDVAPDVAMLDVEMPGLDGLAAAIVEDRGTIGDVDGLAVGREVLGGIERCDGFGAFKDLVGLQRAVERWNGDGRVAAPKEAIRKISQGLDHAVFPQRLSY